MAQSLVKKVSSFPSKAELIRLYGSTYRAFSIAVDEIKTEINWQEGQQKFTPQQVRRIRQHLGEPLTRDELTLK